MPGPHDLKRLDRVCVLHEQPHRRVGSQPAWKRAHHHETLLLRRLDGGNFKFGPGSGLSKYANAVIARRIAAAMIPGPEGVLDAGRDWPSNLAMRCAREPPVAAMAAFK